LKTYKVVKQIKLVQNVKTENHKILAQIKQSENGTGFKTDSI